MAYRCPLICGNALKASLASAVSLLVSKTPPSQQFRSVGCIPAHVSTFRPQRNSFTRVGEIVEVHDAVEKVGSRRISPKYPPGQSGRPVCPVTPQLFSLVSEYDTLFLLLIW